jgi:hypothetical protein
VLRLSTNILVALLLHPLGAFAESISSRSAPLFGDGRYQSVTLSCVRGSPVIAIQGADFTENDVGKVMTVGLVGGGGSPISATVTAVQGRELTLSKAARTTLNSKPGYVVWGHDDAPALRKLFGEGSGTRNIDIFPGPGGGMYLVSSAVELPPHTHVKCHGGATFGMLDGWSAANRHWILVNEHSTGPEIEDVDYVVEGCVFRGNTPLPSTGADAIRMSFAADVSIKGNIFHDFGDHTAFVHSASYTVVNNKGFNATNTCWDNWDAVSHVVIDSNYCETQKHGVQVTGTDTSQTASSISSDVLVRDQTVMLRSTRGAGVWFNGGQVAPGGSAGVRNGRIEGGRIFMSPEAGGSIGACFKISGAGTSNVDISGVRCKNAAAVVNGVDVAPGTPSNVHLDHIAVEVAGALRGGAIQIKAPRSGVERSSVSGTGYRFGIELENGTNQYSHENKVDPGYDGDVHVGGKSAPTASVTNTMRGAQQQAK